MGFSTPYVRRKFEFMGKHLPYITLVIVIALSVNLLAEVWYHKGLTLENISFNNWWLSVQRASEDPQLYQKDVMWNNYIEMIKPLQHMTISKFVVSVRQLLGIGLMEANLLVLWTYTIMFLIGCYLLAQFVVGSAWAGVVFGVLTAIAPFGTSFELWNMNHHVVYPPNRN